MRRVFANFQSNMEFFTENFANRMLDLLNLPVRMRCMEFPGLFERCSLRELQDVFPMIVSSVFGVHGNGVGWGLRVITKKDFYSDFDMLYNFFLPMGPMLRLCYRLLSENIKFEFSLELLPNTMLEMLQSGQYSLFYADLVNVDPFRRQVSSLSLNAFDYYMLHFAIYAIYPLHKSFPAALQVHNEMFKTVYFYITIQYLTTFLPLSPDSVVEPLNITAVKAPQPIPMQTLQPKRSPKYLKIPNTNVYGDTSSPSNPILLNTESPRAHSWRTESVVHFFIDTWLRYDIDESRDIPSSEFIRVVRALVKQMHCFANSATLDQTPMAPLRKLVQPMLKTHIYKFIKTIVNRWPLDATFVVVLELWLSYIQPWRYTPERLCSDFWRATEVVIYDRYNIFIMENLILYTQVFVHVLPRFGRLDLTNIQNVGMLNRVIRVFTQSSLPSKLYHAEKSFVRGGYCTDTSYRHSSYMKNTSANWEWDASFTEDTYIPMFGSFMKAEVEAFVQTLVVSHAYLRKELNSMNRERAERYKYFSFLRNLYLGLFSDNSPEALILIEKSKIPGYLEFNIHKLCEMYDIPLPDLNLSQDLISDIQTNVLQTSYSAYDNSDYLDVSRISPQQVLNNIDNYCERMDPAILPVRSDECKILVRVLHQVSCALNAKYGDEFEKLWNRSDFKGKVARKILYPPMKAQWFDKPKGESELIEKQLPARIILRPLASVKLLILLGLSTLITQFFWSAPSYGPLIIFLCYIIYVLVLALFS